MKLKIILILILTLLGCKESILGKIEPNSNIANTGGIQINETFVCPRNFSYELPIANDTTIIVQVIKTDGYIKVLRVR